MPRSSKKRALATIEFTRSRFSRTFRAARSKCASLGIHLQRFFEDADAAVEVGLVVDALIGFGDKRGKLLALQLFEIDLQGLEQGVVGIFGQVLVAERAGGAEVAVPQMIVRASS